MKITLTTTEGIKEFEDIGSLEEFTDFQGRGTYSLTPNNPKVEVIEVDLSKVLLIHVTKEGEN